jgi:hypothetical protein
MIDFAALYLTCLSVLAVQFGVVVHTDFQRGGGQMYRISIDPKSFHESQGL